MGFLLIMSPAGGLWNAKGDFERPPPAAEEGSEEVGQALALAQAKRSGKA